MKRITKIALFALVAVVGSLFFERGTVYATEEEFEIELSEQELRELSDELDENVETVTKHIVCRIEDTPENMARLIIDGNSEYDERAYSYSYVVYTETLGIRMDIAKITMSGKVYFYKTKQVYLCNMDIDVAIYNGGWDAKITNKSIFNAEDGTLAHGSAYVELVKLGESHLFGCAVRVGNGSSAIYTEITQID